MLLTKLEWEMWAGNINVSENEDAFDGVVTEASFKEQTLGKF